MLKVLRKEEGKPPLFLEIYDEYISLIRNVLFRMVGHSPLDDLTQEVFIKIWKNLPGFQGNSSIKTWIYTIAVRTALDHVRKVGNKTFISLHVDELSHSIHVESSLVNQNLIRKALNHLSFDHRVVLVLHTMEDFSIEEISEMLETPAGTIKSRLHYARSSIREYIDQQGGNP